jgi:Glycosyl hydrolases family 16
MSNQCNPRRLLVALATAALLLLPLGATQAEPPSPNAPGQKFAAYEYWWYPIDFVDHFIEPLNRRRWDKEGQGIARTQNGMLTLMSTRHGSLGVTLRGHSRDRGRWEIRLRGRRYETGNTDYTVAAELVPAGDVSQHCGAQNIGFVGFRPQVDDSARFHVRTLPDHEFTSVRRQMNLTNDYWHTYGVEVTPNRIAWFVDGVARAVENRPEALSGIRLALRLQLQDVDGETMNLSRLQVDTVRYFTLDTPNKKPVRGGLPVEGTYADVC